MAFSSEKIRISLSADEELAGKIALEKICHLADGGHVSAQADLGQDIYLSTLDSCLRLAQDPATIQHLSNPLVIRGCIGLLKSSTAKHGYLASTFHYEYGYLCFNLLTASLNLCLLEKYDPLHEALEACEPDEEHAAHYWTSVALALVVTNQFRLLDGVGDCHWVPSWSVATMHEQDLLLPPSDISCLLNMLWDDRKFVLATSQLSGLLFLFTQYVFYEQYSNNNLHADKLKDKLYEIALRYLLVAEQFQREATIRVIDSCHAPRNKWSVTPKQVDTEDSRLLMTALIKRLSDENDPNVFLTRDPFIMFRLITTATDAESQDLLPAVVQCAIKFGWSMLFGIDQSQAYRLQGTARTLFGILTSLICPTHNPTPIYSLKELTRKQILATMYDGDLLDLTAYIMIQLNPTESGGADFVLHCFTLFFAALSDRMPASELEYCFRAYAPDWWKFNWYLILLRDGIIAVPTEYRNHYYKFQHYWFQFARLLGIASALDDHLKLNCSSPRCPIGSSNEAARFRCSDCVQIWYCNRHCQAMDWKFGGHRKFHLKLTEEDNHNLNM